MQISAGRLVMAAVTKWGHSGKVDYDPGVRMKRVTASSKRTMCKVKKKIRKYLEGVLE